MSSETLAINGYNTLRDLCQSSGNPSSSNCNDLQDCCGESFITTTAAYIKQSFTTLKTSRGKQPNMISSRNQNYQIKYI